ncbi:MAG TPA: hypothetical protein VJA86_03310 [Candidatus Nanoarchaeia archaeon]|nr:hypothetical protein [Candidatus Nanoarchaeia archaeon]
MKRIFRTNPEKAGNRVAINSFLIGSLFTIFTLIWTLSPEKFSVIIVTQISLAIPLLFVSSLAYSKVAYWKETRLWDTLGWYTNNLATIFIFNVVGLMIADYFVSLAFAYFSATILLMLIYSIINFSYNPSFIKEKLFKFLFFVIVLFLGGILPVLLQ